MLHTFFLLQLEQMRNKLAEDVTERERIETLQAQLISSQETIDSLEKHITQQKVNVFSTSQGKARNVLSFSAADAVFSYR